MNKGEKKNKKQVNVDLFQNNITPESAYILGLLWADGHIYTKTRVTTVNCILTDLDSIIPVFNKTGLWNISKPIKKTFKGKSVKTQRKISTSTWGLYDILYSHNYHSKSISNATIVGIIPDPFLKYWVRGYLDGDGCIKIGKKYGVEVVFAGGYLQNWQFMKDICGSLNVNYSITQTINKRGGYSHFRISRKRDVNKLLNYVYCDYTPSEIGFPRKYLQCQTALVRIEQSDKKLWSLKDIKYLKENYLKFGAQQCSIILGKTKNSIYNKIRSLK